MEVSDTVTIAVQPNVREKLSDFRINTHTFRTAYQSSFSDKGKGALEDSRAESSEPGCSWIFWHPQ